MTAVKKGEERRVLTENILRPTFYLLLTLILLLQSCASHQGEQHKPGSVTLKLRVLPNLNNAPYFIAEEEGYFAEQGLEIEFVKINRSAEALPALDQGQLDVLGGVANYALLNTIARGARIKVVAGRGYLSSKECDSSAFVVRRGLIEAGKLESAAQLQGKRFAIKSASTSEYYTEKILYRMGLSLNQIEVVDVPDEVLPEALSRGTVDIAYVTEPLLTRILRSGNAAVWMSVQQIVPGFETALFVMYGPNLLDKNPDAGRRFMVAYLKAVRQYNQGKTERNLEIMVKHTGLDRELLQQACWPSFHVDGRVNMQSVLDYQDWGLKKGMVDRAVTEEQLWDPSYVEYANRVLGPDSAH